MTITNGTLAQLEAKENMTLISLWVDLKARLDSARECMSQIEYVLIQRMASSGATAIPDETYDVRLEFPPPLYDNGKLAKLRELLPEDVIATAWMPEHRETITVQERWDARIFKAWVKFGKEIQDIIDQARVPGPPKLRIKPKNKSHKSEETQVL